MENRKSPATRLRRDAKSAVQSVNEPTATVASGNYHEVDSVVDVDEDTKIIVDSTVPTFGDVQFFADGTLRVVSTRQEMHQTATTHVSDTCFNAGRTIFTAESRLVTADGRMLPQRSKSSLLKRSLSDDSGNSSDAFYQPQAAAAAADGTGIAVLAEVDRSASFLGKGRGDGRAAYAAGDGPARDRRSDRCRRFQ